MATPIILDCDPGIDDAIALLMAVSHPAIELRAVTCVAGNVPLEHTQDNARRLLTLIDRTDIPVAAGMARPLMRELVTAPDVHGKSGLGGATTPEPTFDLDPRHAVDLLIELFEASDGRVILVATGPLTNVAMALLRGPQIKDKIKRIILMGGAYGQGNHTPSAEFNILVDPHAAHIVFSSGVPITMVGLDVTHQAVVGPEEIAGMRRLNTVGALAADMLDFYGSLHKQWYGSDLVPLHDPCCIAEVISPGLIETRPMNVQIETCSPLTVGRTVCDVIGVTRLPPTADVGVHLENAKFIDILMDCLRRYA